MAAIAGFDDLHAWLVRGFVEAGVREGTSATPEGALDVGSFLGDQGAGGLQLHFLGQAGADPVPEDEYVYQVYVVRDATGERVIARCAETVYHQVFADRPRETVGARVVAHIRQHNDRLTAWRAQGGEVSYAERLSIPEVRGVACERALVQHVAELRRRGVALEAGPAQGWWTMSRAQVGAAITAGKGAEPTYRLGKDRSADMEAAENRAFADRVRPVGTAFAVLGGLGLLYVVGGGAATWWTYGSRYGAAVIASGLLWSAAALVCGLKMRALRSLTLVRVLAALTMLPCWGACCMAGLPLGAWALWVLKEPRARVVFQ